jgi:hypothetical protein
MPAPTVPGAAECGDLRDGHLLTEPQLARIDPDEADLDRHHRQQAAEQSEVVVQRKPGRDSVVVRQPRTPQLRK